MWRPLYFAVGLSLKAVACTVSNVFVVCSNSGAICVTMALLDPSSNEETKRIVGPHYHRSATAAEFFNACDHVRV